MRFFLRQNDKGGLASSNVALSVFTRFSGDSSFVRMTKGKVISSNLGLSVATDDIGIRVIFPQLTTETREKLVRVLKEKLEESRITVRRERERVWDEVQKEEKASKLTEDEKFRAKEELQKIIDEVNTNLEATFEKKQKEVMR